MTAQKKVTPKYVAFSIRDIPHSLGLTLFKDVMWNHTVVLFAVRRTPRGLDRIPAGTGTLVSYLDRRYVLTAHHVWHKLLSKADYVGIFVKPSAGLYQIERRFLDPIVVGRYIPGHAERGPDLALIPLGPPDISRLEANKVFYSLDIREKRLQKAAPKYNFGLWFVVGAPAELNEVTPHGICLAIRAYGSVLRASYIRNGFDYFDFSLDHPDRPTMPSSFAGLSGGGLWHVHLSPSRSTGKISIRGKPTLEGVIFYEEFEARGIGFIRCHGRRSLYRKLLSTLKRPMYRKRFSPH